MRGGGEERANVVQWVEEERKERSCETLKFKYCRVGKERKRTLFWQERRGARGVLLSRKFKSDQRSAFLDFAGSIIRLQTTMLSYVLNHNFRGKISGNGPSGTTPAGLSITKLSK